MQQRGMGSVYLRGDVYWIKYYRNGKPKRESSHSKKRDDALRLLKQRQGEIVTGKYIGVGPEKIRLSALFEMVIDDYIDKEKRDLYIVKKRIEKHLDSALGKVRAADFGTDHVKKYIRDRKASAKKPSNATINRELAILRRAFTLAAQCNPPKVGRIPTIEELPEENTRQGFVEHPQYLALRDELPGYARLALVIGYHCGNRKGEILALEWSMIDLKSKEIRIPGRLTKNKKQKTIPIYGEMGHWLSMAKAERDAKHPGCKWVINEEGKRLTHFRRSWASACTRVGLDDLLFHDLRRSAVRNMERAGIPRAVAMAISGHETETVYRRYAIVSMRDLKDAGSKLESFHAAQIVPELPKPKGTVQ